MCIWYKKRKQQQQQHQHQNESKQGPGGKTGYGESLMTARELKPHESNNNNRKGYEQPQQVLFNTPLDVTQKLPRHGVGSVHRKIREGAKNEITLEEQKRQMELAVSFWGEVSWRFEKQLIKFGGAFLVIEF